MKKFSLQCTEVSGCSVFRQFFGSHEEYYQNIVYKRCFASIQHDHLL